MAAGLVLQTIGTGNSTNTLPAYFWDDGSGNLTPFGALPPQNIATGQGSVTTTSAQLVAARNPTGSGALPRRSVTVINTGSTTLFFGRSGVTATAGVPIPAGAAVTITFTGALYTVTASGSTTAAYYELF